MSAPERIWAETEGGWMPHDCSEIRRSPCIEYTRTDLIPAMIQAAEQRALDSVTTLHTVIAAIRDATVGSKPMLADLPAALVEWRREAVEDETKRLQTGISKASWDVFRERARQIDRDEPPADTFGIATDRRILVVIAALVIAEIDKLDAHAIRARKGGAE